MRVVVYNDAGRMLYDVSKGFIVLRDKGENIRCTKECDIDFVVEPAQVLIKYISEQVPLSELVATVSTMVANAATIEKEEVLQ